MGKLYLFSLLPSYGENIDLSFVYLQKLDLVLFEKTALVWLVFKKKLNSA